MRRLLLVLGLAGLTAAPVAAQGDFTGTWAVEADYSTGSNNNLQVQCLYEGTAELQGTSGPVQLMLVGTSPAGNDGVCESSLAGTADVEGQRNGTVFGKIVTTDSNDPNGLAEFTGSLSGTLAPASSEPTITKGELRVTGGLFADLVANFSASRQPAVPSLPAAARGLLLALLVGGGGYLLLRRREAGLRG